MTVFHLPSKILGHRAKRAHVPAAIKEESTSGDTDSIVGVTDDTPGVAQSIGRGDIRINYPIREKVERREAK